jgi:hypothetical protein
VGDAVHLRIARQEVGGLESAARDIPLEQVHHSPDLVRDQRDLLEHQALANSGQPGQKDAAPLDGGPLQGSVNGRPAREQDLSRYAGLARAAAR